MPLPKKPMRQSPNWNMNVEMSQKEAVKPVTPRRQMAMVLMDMYTGSMNCPAPEKKRK